MVRYARDDDIPAMKMIWNACFPRDIEYGEFFFRELYSKAVLFEQDGKVTGMLHMLPFTRDDGESVTYIYGVSVLPEHRGNGQSAALIKEVLRTNTICVLIPAEPWLFGFYGNFGFKTVFFRHNFTTPPLNTARKAKKADIPFLRDIYAKSVTPRLERTDRHWEHYLNDVFIFSGGYAVISGERVIEAFGDGMSPTMTNIPYGMATGWKEKSYLGLMYD
ncbi:MAG: GNAT family N-acetyltransferase [Oscillospiraceae bacterium]|nr:GNAT family N-acetyltransferase [Oscillospiraceae bacterium]